MHSMTYNMHSHCTVMHSIMHSHAQSCTVVGQALPDAQNTIPGGDVFPRVWIQRRSSVEDRTIDGVGGLVQEFWDVELHVEAAEANDTGGDTIEDLAAGIKERWDGAAGNVGSTDGDYFDADGIFVRDHSDEYAYKGIDSGEGVHLAALDVENWRQST